VDWWCIANHAAEIDEATSSALGRMVDAGIRVLNHAVPAAGVESDDLGFPRIVVTLT